MVEQEALFATKYQVTLAPKAKCSFLGTGNVMLEWEPYESFTSLAIYPNPVWTYVLNYSLSSCQLSGGDTIEQAARNISNGEWLKANANCAYYVVVGNNLPGNQNAVFSFTRSSALRLMIVGVISSLAFVNYLML